MLDRPPGLFLIFERILCRCLIYIRNILDFWFFVVCYVRVRGNLLKANTGQILRKGLIVDSHYSGKKYQEESFLVNSEIPDNVIEMLGLDGSPERDPDKIAHLAIDFYIDRLRFIEEAEDMPMVALLLASRACKELTNNKKNTHKTLRKWQISVLRYFWRMEMWAKSDDFPCPFDFDGPAPHKSEPANTLKGTASELLFLNAIQAAKSLNPIWGNMEEFKRCSNEHKDTVNDYIKNMLEPQWSSLEIDRVLIGRIEKAEISSLMSKNSDKAQRPHDAFFKLVNAETDRLIAPTKKAGIAVTREMALAFFKASVEVISDGLSKDESDKVSGMESATINTRFKRYFAKSH